MTLSQLIVAAILGNFIIVAFMRYPIFCFSDFWTIHEADHSHPTASAYFHRYPTFSYFPPFFKFRISD